ncbi:MAG: sigma 54-interacting transcriptional regulator [Thermoanaerobaculia bacterium]|nr:sigma 54-interacting transcriptional regulator [Thermoanaerobaculia bacterium]
MIEATEVLRAYLRGILRFSGARSATLFVPTLFGGASEPLLLHSGDEPGISEFADSRRALAFAERFTPGADAGEAPQMVRGAEPGCVLLPLPTPAPTWFWGLSEDSQTGVRRTTDHDGGRRLPPAAWLGLALPGELPDELRRALAGDPVPPSGGPGAEGDGLWGWLFTLGGALAAHTTQVAALGRDALTNLPDRTGLQALLPEAIDRAEKTGRGFGLLLVNPDDFQSVNERFGRDAGDEVIREIAHRLRHTLRRSDLLARYGSVIFAAVLPETVGEGIREVAAKLHPVLMEAAYLDGAVRLGFSVGSAAFDPADDQPPSALELVRRADQALNAAKREGGGCISDWDEGAPRREAGAFDRLSGIFTGNMANDYRNMVLLSEALTVIAEHQEPEALVSELIDRLHGALRPERIGLFAASGAEEPDARPELLRGVTRVTASSGGQSRLATVELDPSELRLLRVALAAGEPRSERLGEGEEARSAHAIPLLAADHRLGCLYLDGPSASFDLEEADLLFLEALAAQVAVALDRAQLAERDQRRQESEKKLLRAELNELRHALQHSKMVYASPEMEAVVATARRVAPTDATVLITGESGTGKELLARTVHELSPRRGQRMVVVDCSAIAASLIESELFGHEKGAFTGAQQRRPGRLAEADGGTVLLDEIGELPLEVQSKLLRFVQERQFITVGGTRPRRVDVRILAATNRDLAGEVRAGRFRQDLFHRLNVVRLEIPALRERPRDILHLARHFLESYAIRYQKSPLRLAADAEAALRRYPWPGNVRELQNRLMRAVILSEATELGAADLDLPRGAVPAPGQPLPDEPADASPREEESPLDRLRAGLAREVDLALASGAHAAFPLGKWLSDDLVLAAHTACNGVARQGAARIGIPETTYRRRLERASEQAEAGLSPRTGTWEGVQEILGQVVSELGGGGDLLAAAETILLEEIRERLPDDNTTGAKLLGVTPPTYRARVARMA